MQKVFILLFIACYILPLTSYADYKIYNVLPCNFNGAKLTTSAKIAINSTMRCSKSKGYPGKRGTSLEIERGTPIFAITDMRLVKAIDRSAKQRCRVLNVTHEGLECDYIYDDVALTFKDKEGNFILFYHLMSTPFVPGFGKGKCERPLEFGTEKHKRDPYNCGGYSEKIEQSSFVKKGDLIGYSGTTGNNQLGDQHISFSFISSLKNLDKKHSNLCKEKLASHKENLKECRGINFIPWCISECYLAPESKSIGRLWENENKNPIAYLLPVLSKNYLSRIGFIQENDLKKLYNKQSLDIRKNIQVTLKQFGYNSKLDGLWGSKTWEAIQYFLDQNELRYQKNHVKVLTSILEY